MANNITMGPMGFFMLAVGFMSSIGGAYWMGQKNNDRDPLAEYNAKFDAYQDSVVKPALVSADSLQRVVDSTRMIADSALFVANTQTGVITSLRGTVSKLRKRNTDIVDSVQADTTLPPVCDQCRRAVVGLQQEIVQLNNTVAEQEVRDTARVVTINQLTVGLSASTARGDSLQKVIINFPAPPRPNQFLGVTLPRIPSQYVILGAIGTGILISR